jgi:hypothetical protein
MTALRHLAGLFRDRRWHRGSLLPENCDARVEHLHRVFYGLDTMILVERIVVKLGEKIFATDVSADPAR